MFCIFRYYFLQIVIRDLKPINYFYDSLIVYHQEQVDLFLILFFFGVGGGGVSFLERERGCCAPYFVWVLVFGNIRMFVKPGNESLGWQSMRTR